VLLPAREARLNSREDLCPGHALQAPMMPGGRGMNPRMMQQMMKQLGISVEEIDDVQRVIIETPTKDIIFTKPSVSAMKAQGQTTYQVQGEPQMFPKGGRVPVKEGIVERHPAETGAGVLVSPKPGESGATPAKSGPLFTEDDVKMVMQAASVNREKARKALEESDGEVATAIVKLTEGR
jgi:nascent polypeptide-associated complex subunit alpha